MVAKRRVVSEVTSQLDVFATDIQMITRHSQNFTEKTSHWSELLCKQVKAQKVGSFISLVVSNFGLPLQKKREHCKPTIKAPYRGNTMHKISLTHLLLEQ
jgi:hypothetical protein